MDAMAINYNLSKDAEPIYVPSTPAEESCREALFRNDTPALIRKLQFKLWNAGFKRGVRDIRYRKQYLIYKNEPLLQDEPLI